MKGHWKRYKMNRKQIEDWVRSSHIKKNHEFRPLESWRRTVSTGETHRFWSLVTKFTPSCLFGIARKRKEGKKKGNRTLLHYQCVVVFVGNKNYNTLHYYQITTSFRHRMMLLKRWSWLCWSLTPVVVLELIKGTLSIWNNVALSGCVACVLPAVRVTTWVVGKACNPHRKNKSLSDSGDFVFWFLVEAF